jgi:hypothetical protein
MTGFKWDEEISVAPDARYTEVRKYDLDKLDLTTRNVLDIGVIAQVGMEKTRFKGSEDFADLFDSIGIVLQYSANRMLKEIYGEDADTGFDWSDEKIEELNGALVCIEQFNLIQKLKK